MKMETAKKAERLNFAIIQQQIEVENIEKALKKCETDKTELYWSAYGNLSLVDGWGREDVKRALVKSKAKLAKLEKELEDL